MEKRFISATREFCTREKHINAPLLRKVFSWQGKYRKAVIEIAVAGFYRLFVNGEELTKGYFAPYISNPDNIVYQDNYDITGKLQDKNVLCVLLGNGFNNSMDCGVWDFESAPYRSAPKMWLQLTVDGDEIVTSDETFSACLSPITFDDYRCGEHFDMRLMKKGVLQPDYEQDDSFFPVFCVKAPLGQIKVCESQPVKAFENRKPIDIIRCGTGYIYDFGQNDSGICKLRVDGQNGQEIVLTHGEILKDGKLDLSNILFKGRSQEGYVQCDHYICVDGYQEYTPSFTYHGFRYVYVEGITPLQAKPELLTYIVLHSDIPKRGTFSCSMEEVERIQDCTLRSDTSNFVYFPTDCPQREKNGWTADASLSTEQLLYNFDCGSSLREWMNNVRKAQREDGALPGIIPTSGWGFKWGNGPAWDHVLAEIPYQVYRFYGDKQIIYENAAAIIKYVDYLKTKVNEQGLLSFGLGDWCEAGSSCGGDYSTPREVTDTLKTIDLLNKAVFMLQEIGDVEQANRLRHFGESLKVAFSRKYISEKGMVSCCTQTGQAMAMAFGVIPEQDMSAAYRQLRKLVHDENDHFKVGVLGISPLLSMLSENGEVDLALKLVTQHSFPSYSYNIDLGATTLWETFDEMRIENGVFYRKDGGKAFSSQNHHFWGSVSAWFYKYLAGVNLLDFKTVSLMPRFASALNFVKASYRNGSRYVSVEWKRNQRGIKLIINLEGIIGNLELSGWADKGGRVRKFLDEGRHEFFLQKMK